MGQEIPKQELDETLASASISPTPQQDGAPVQLHDVDQSIVREADKAWRDEQSTKNGSTGPRSEAGKRRSSRNSLKHGFFAKFVVVPGESSAKYRSLLKSLRDEKQPVGPTEEFLVGIIANTMWRLQRHYAADSAEIRRSREFLEWDKRTRQADEAEEIGSKSGVPPDLLNPEPGLIWKICNPLVLERCLELLLELQRKMKANGFEHKRNTAILETLYGTNKHLSETLYHFYRGWAEIAKLKEESRSQGAANPEECKKYFLSELAAEIRWLRNYQKDHDSVESERMELEVLRRNVPGPEISEHLRKNEVALLKELERAINLLDRLQRLRRGQPVTPRIDVNF
jgi:hypothetical protein